MIAICAHYCVKWFGNPFYFTVNQCDCDTSEHSAVNGKTPSDNYKNRKQVVFVIIPFENHIVGSCTNNAYRDQPKSKIVYVLLVDAGFSASRKDFLLHIGSIPCFLAFLSLPAAYGNRRRYASECIADCPFAAPAFCAVSP